MKRTSELNLSKRVDKPSPTARVAADMLKAQSNLYQLQRSKGHLQKELSWNLMENKKMTFLNAINKSIVFKLLKDVTVKQ